MSALRRAGAPARSERGVECVCCGTEAGSYLRLIDSCITQLKAHGPYRTCNESKEEKEYFSGESGVLCI